jgi:hypothetical protein
MSFRSAVTFCLQFGPFFAKSEPPKYDSIAHFATVDQ